jgi:hypothetical protein
MESIHNKLLNDTEEQGLLEETRKDNKRKECERKNQLSEAKHAINMAAKGIWLSTINIIKDRILPILLYTLSIIFIAYAVYIIFIYIFNIPKTTQINHFWELIKSLFSFIIGAFVNELRNCKKSY